MGLRSGLAVGAGRVTRWVLHGMMHRSASQLPGRVAMGIDPHVLEHLRSKALRGSLVVCGTNGKTTTTNVIAAALEAQGMRVLCNREGANMAAGAVSALLSGGSADWAVIESDELSTIHILPELRPSFLVLLNLFRDQLDRAGEIDHVQDTIVAALAASPGTTLVVCGDDPLCMGVAKRAQAVGTRLLIFRVGQSLGLPPDRVPEARFCQQCGSELVYEYRTYAQLGKFSCPACGFCAPTTDFLATNVHVESSCVSFDLARESRNTTQRVHADFGGAYMVYNLLAAASVTSLLGVGEVAFQRALDAFHPDNGRLQHFKVEGREVVLNLAKNPTGFNQNLLMLLGDSRRKAVFVVINDDYNDGRDISWIWDVDFERLVNEDVVMVVAGGHRANDLQVRLKYAGVRAPIAKSVQEALAAFPDLPVTCPLYVITNYSALWPTKDELKRLGESRG